MLGVISTANVAYLFQLTNKRLEKFGIFGLFRINKNNEK